MRKIILALYFLGISLNMWSQKNSLGIGISAYNHVSDDYGYKFNEFSRVFKSSNILYSLVHFHLFYNYKVNNLYSGEITTDFFVREYREIKEFALYEIGFTGRDFGSVTLRVNRQLISKWKNTFILSATLGLAYRRGNEFFYNGKINNEYFIYTIPLEDAGCIVGVKARYVFYKKNFVNTNFDMLNYIIGPKWTTGSFNKNWTVFQTSFTVGINF